MKIDLSKIWRVLGIPDPIEEYMFHPERKWRFDYAWPAYMIAVEVEGGIWIGGRHNRPVGMKGDMLKYNEAARLGWRVFRFTHQQFNNGEAGEYLSDLFEQLIRKESSYVR